MKRYYVETWDDSRPIADFDTAEERELWRAENCYSNHTGSYLKETGERIAYYEW